MSTAARRRRQASASSGGGKRARRSLDLAARAAGDADDDDVIASDDDDDEQNDGRTPVLDSDDDDEEEPLEAKRVRLAREYLNKVDAKDSDSSSSSSSDSDSDSEEEEDDHDRLGRKLQRQRQKQQGTLERDLADRLCLNVQSLYADPEKEVNNVTCLKGHDLTPTCIAMSGTTRAVSGSKDHSVILWDLETQTKLCNLLPTWKRNKTEESKNEKFRTLGQVLAVACSDDERYAAVGKRDGTLSIFDIRTKSIVKEFKTNPRKPIAVTCLAFRSTGALTGSLDLFAGAADRCVRQYNCQEMMLLETLYGHDFSVTDIACSTKTMPISVAQDRTARAWKIQEETHLIFRSGAKALPADCVSCIKDDWFLTGHQDGQVMLWSTHKKKPVVTVTPHAGSQYGIACLASIPGSDLCATGSHDGFVRFCKVEATSVREKCSLECLQDSAVPLPGYVNAIAFCDPKAKALVAAVGQEPRLGRWNRIPKAKNRIAIVKLQEKQPADDQEDDQED